MNRSTGASPLRRLRGREGIALPLALLGLVMTSILISSILVTSATEGAASAAHQDATSSLFTTSGALEAFVAERGVAALVPEVVDEYVPPGGGPPVRIDVERLASVPSAVAGVNRETYSLRAEPVGGGRAVIAMVEIGPLELNVESAATFGGNARIGGSTIVSDGRDSESCNLPAAENAVVHGRGTTVDTVGNRVAIIGAVKEETVTGEELIRQTLGGYSIEEFLAHIHGLGLTSAEYVQFGNNSIWGSQPAFSGTGNNKPSSLRQTGNQRQARDPTHRYNWYCPGRMDNATNSKCWEVVSAADTLKYKIVAIDAGGSEVTIQGDHGQGIIAVVNGGLRISGGFIFRGLVLSTHDIDITGTGNKVEGAIVSKNQVRVDRPNDSDSEILGNAVVRFNRCAINRVMETVNAGGVASLRMTRTFAWAEVVR